MKLIKLHGFEYDCDDLVKGEAVYINCDKIIKFEETVYGKEKHIGSEMSLVDDDNDVFCIYETVNDILEKINS